MHPEQEMRKKIISILSLYFAGMILLAFLVFPHHHHSHFICFNTSHCQQEAQADNTSHDHSPYSDKAGCVDRLFQAEIAKNVSRQLTDNGEGGQNHHFTISFYTLSDILGILSFNTGSDRFPDPRDEIFHQLISATHQGTRAPPVC